MPPGGEHRGGGGGVRLLDEAGDAEGARRVGQRLAALDVAVAGFRRGWLHAEGYHLPGARRDHGNLQRPVQRGRIGDRGVSGHHPQHRVRVLLGHQAGGGGDRRGGVAADRLQHDAPRFQWPVDPRCRQAIPAARICSAIRNRWLLVAHHYRWGETGAAGAQRGLLDQRAIGQQRPELLGEALARHRPQPCAGPAGQDDRDDAVFAHTSPIGSERGTCPLRMVDRGRRIWTCCAGVH